MWVFVVWCFRDLRNQLWNCQKCDFVSLTHTHFYTYEFVILDVFNAIFHFTWIIFSILFLPSEWPHMFHVLWCIILWMLCYVYARFLATICVCAAVSFWCYVMSVYGCECFFGVTWSGYKHTCDTWDAFAQRYTKISCSCSSVECEWNVYFSALFYFLFWFSLNIQFCIEINIQYVLLFVHKLFTY